MLGRFRISLYLCAQILLPTMDIVFLIIILVLLIGFGLSIYFMYSHYEQRLEKELNRAQKSEQLKSVFLDNVSHTLRTPLNAILSYSKLLLDEHEDNIQPAQVKELATYINKDTQQLLDYLKQLLDLSSLEGGMPSFTFIEVNLAELMASYRREAMNFTKPEVSIRIRSTLSVHCKGTLDTNFMHQLMITLLSNAAKECTQGEIILFYGDEIRNRRGIRVTITYMGNGQSQLVSGDLFTFLQNQSSLSSGNETTGMSLSTCKVIIDALAGEMDVDTQNGKTTATFWFPCKMRDRHKGI